MMRASSLVCAVAGVLAFASTAAARTAFSEIQDPKAQAAFESSAEPLEKSSSFPRVYLFGGPGSLEGSFQNAQGAPDWHGWTSVDLTDVPPGEEYWQRSTFNAENLNGNGPGNWAMWCGRSAEQEPGWANPPGYGNSWDAPLRWSSGPLSDPSIGRTVELDFFLNYDAPDFGYDFTTVRYSKSGQWVTLWTFDGTNGPGGVFDPPGVRFSELGAPQIVFDGNDYGGPDLDEIVLEIRFTSDGAWSDEQGPIPSVAGAAQVDDITVRYPDGVAEHVSFEDFEGAEPYAWFNAERPVVGDFAKILSGLTDIDPCRQNSSPQATFIDDGTPPNNLPGQSTGGSTSQYGTYGTPEGWVINLTGGIAGGTERLRNEIWSPPIAVDAPGPVDDGLGWQTYLQYTVFYHSIGFQPGNLVKMRQSSDGVIWNWWTNVQDFFFFAPARPGYYDNLLDLDDRISASTEYIQIALVPVDPADFGFGNPSIDDAATPAPWFDDVMVFKEQTGPELETDRLLMFDAFASNGSVDVSTPTARDALDVALDSFDASVIRDDPRLDTDPIDIAAIPLQLRLVWILEKNPLFEDALRTMPPGASVLPGTSPLGGDRWTGFFVDPNSSSVSAAFPLPDENFMYPGDVLRWYAEVTTAQGVVRTAPPVLEGFLTGEGWDEDYTVRALPSVRDEIGTAPSILVVDYDDRRAGDDPRLLKALALGGYALGIDFDYIRINPRHDGVLLGDRASDAQLATYTTLVVLEPDQSFDTIFEDRPELDTWFASSGDRHAFWIGTSLVSRLNGFAPGFVSDRLGVELLGTDSDAIVGDSRYPGLVPQPPFFDSDGILELGCFGLRFDRLAPRPGAVVGHGITAAPPAGPTLPGIAGSIVYDRTLPQGRRLDVTLPIDVVALSEPRMKSPGQPAATKLLFELLQLANQPGSGAVPVPTPGRPGLDDARAEPNPFNPATTIRFRLGVDGPVTVRVVNLRGEVVRKLHDGWLAAGEQSLRWDGRTDDGRFAASGIYFADVRGNDRRVAVKMALLK